MTDNNTFLAVSAADFNNIATETIDHVCYSVSCFLCELPIILRVGRKLKGWAGDYCKSVLNIELVSWFRRYIMQHIENLKKF